MTFYDLCMYIPLLQIHLLDYMFRWYVCQLYDGSSDYCVNHKRNDATVVSLLHLSTIQRTLDLLSFVICKFERQIKHNLFSFTNLKSSTGKRIKLGHLDILWFWLQSQHNMFIYQLYKKFGILYVYYGKIVQIQFF